MSDIQALKERVKGMKVLFVDDERDVRHGTGIFLRKIFDDVLICSNGQEGLSEFIKNKDFDVVITDVMMPVMDGVTMLKEIRKIDSNVFTIILTASRSLSDLEKDLGNITLQKPLSFDDMILVMKKLEEIK